MAQTIDGRAYAKNLKSSMKDQITKAIERGVRPPCLATVLISNDGGSVYYVNNQRKVCEEIGINFKLLKLDENTNEEEVLKVIDNLNQDENVDGIMLQVPLPKGLNENLITNRISPEKDVDGLTDLNTGKFYRGEKAFVPCTPRSALELIKSTNCDIKGKKAVVLGRSNIVGKPMFQLLLNENATVTVCHSKTVNLKEICSEADILVVAIGKPKFVDNSFVKEGAVVIDVGTSSFDGKICGDVDFDKVYDKASYITPVPGGVGALTTTLLVKNTCEAWERNVCKNFNSISIK